MNFVQTYAAAMACMMVGLNSVMVVWFFLQPDWKPERVWEKAGWFESFDGKWKRAMISSTHVCAAPTGSRSTGSPEGGDLSTAFTLRRRSL